MFGIAAVGIDMAFVLVFRRYAPFGSFGFGFEGDHRDKPSMSSLVSARTIGCVPFDRGGIGAMHAYSSGTQYVGAGDAVRRFLGRPLSIVEKAVRTSIVSANAISFTAQTAGANPMIPGAPAIDTFLDVRVEWIANSLRVQGSVRGDDFPNAEVFVLDSKGTGRLLFDGRTTGGQNTGPMTRLAGANDGQQLGSFSCVTGLGADGSFLSSKPSCPVTVMKPAAKHAGTGIGSGGRFSGGSASGRW
jgi:hypothetical protein